MSVLAATNKSIAAAVKAGTLSLTTHAGPIAAIRKLARQIDHKDFPIIAGKFDNVSLSAYLRYCAALQIIPADVEPAPKSEPKEPASKSGGEAGGGSKLAKLRSVHTGKAAAS